MDKEITHCECCGASIREWNHSLTKGLVETLVSFSKALKSKGENCIHLQTEVPLSKNGYNNFQKLRYFGLVAKAKDENKERKGGYWLLTLNGLRFLRGEINIPKTITTYRNVIIDRSEERIFISNVLPAEYFQKDFS